MTPTISRREWLWVAGWALLLLLLTSLPYLYGAALSTPANQFSGFVLGVDDGNSYLAKMRLGADGAWQFHLFYTSEPHEGATLFLFHLLLGKLARLAHLPLLAVYHAARLLFGLLLLAMVYLFAAHFTPNVSLRRLSLGLVAVGSGLGWLVIALGQLDRLGLPLDFYLPEAFVFHLLLALPHLSLALSLLLAALLLTLHAWESGRWLWAGLAGLALLLLAVIAAFYYFIFAAVLGVTLLLRWRQAAFRWREAGQLALPLAIAAPLPLYYATIAATIPVFGIWARQHNFQSPAPVHYLLAFGPLAALAIIGAWRVWRAGSRPGLLLVGWLAVSPLLLYVPLVTLQRRLAFGLQVALAVLAAQGAAWLWCEKISGRWPRLRRRWPLAALALVALFSLSNLLILAGTALETGRRAQPVFQPGAIVAAADWLAGVSSPDTVVLAAYNTANFLPTHAPGRMFIGHGPETIHPEQKSALVQQFYAAATPNDWRQQFLAQYGIDLVFWGPEERALGQFLPGQVSYLHKVYDNGEVAIFEVVKIPG